MLFNSLTFLLLFLPVALVGYYALAALKVRFAVGWLVGMSLLFYAWWSPVYLVLLIASVLANYGLGVGIQRMGGKAKWQRCLLFAGIAGNLGLLGYYKYLFPLLHWLEGFGISVVPPQSSIALPLGISFFTFTQIGYLIDCQSGMASRSRFLDYSLFVTFFPHLIAGPILHHREMMPQFESAEMGRLRWDRLNSGFTLFFMGLAKKDLVADYFAEGANVGFAHVGHLGVGDAWCAVLSYSMQLYFDFSGYSDMALGLALLFNIRFPANFDSPYKSLSVIDFWQRWHITLSHYLNVYLFNPIAMAITRRRLQSGKKVGWPGLKTLSGFLGMVALPTFITLFLAGIWHGAGFTFLIYGLLHAAYLILNHAWRVLFQRRNMSPRTGVARLWEVLWKAAFTYAAVLLAQIFFRASTVSDALAMLGDLCGRSGVRPVTALIDWKVHPELFLPFAFLFVWIAPNALQVFAPWQPSLTTAHQPIPAWLQWKPNLAWAVLGGLTAAIALLSVSRQTEFIYFRF